MGTVAPDHLTGIKVDMRMGRAMDITAPEVRLMGITAPEDFLIHRMKINYLRHPIPPPGSRVLTNLAEGIYGTG